jgi:hypothetical protein
MRTNEKTTTLASREDVNVRVDYFWIDHEHEGKLINWTDQVELPIGWLHANVRIDLLEFTEHFEGLDRTQDFKVPQLYINEEFIGELLGTKLKHVDGREVLKCAVAVGCG